MRWLSRVVSVLLIAAAVVGIGALIRSKMPASEVGEGFTTCARFRDATRIATGSPVMIAGVRVGEVVHLSIEGSMARIDMRLLDNTVVPIDSWVTKRSYSAFGDNYIEIIPADPQPGAPTSQMLRPGQCLTRVAEGSSTDRILRSLVRAMPRIEDGLERVAEVAAYGREWAAGVLGDRTRDVEAWLAAGNIESPLRSADEALARLERGSVAAAEAVHGAAPNVLRQMDRLTSGITTARKRMTEVKGDLRNGLANAREGLNDVDETVADLTEVVAAVDQGRGNDAKGTLGRLINDPQLGQQLVDASERGIDGVRSFTRFKSWLGLRTEFNVFSAQPRFFVTAEIRARTDKFYLVELERGPLGELPSDTLGDLPGVSTFNRTMVLRDGIRFTAQFGKTFGNWFQVRGGLKESTFGIGTDVFLGTGRLKLSGDVYGSLLGTPRVKLTGALRVFRSAYLIAGIDDALNDPRYLNIRGGGEDVPAQFDRVRLGRDYFLGATLHFDDADLAVLLRVYGALLIGLL